MIKNVYFTNCLLDIGSVYALISQISVALEKIRQRDTLQFVGHIAFDDFICEWSGQLRTLQRVFGRRTDERLLQSDPQGISYEIKYNRIFTLHMNMSSRLCFRDSTLSSDDRMNLCNTQVWIDQIHMKQMI